MPAGKTPYPHPTLELMRMQRLQRDYLSFIVKVKFENANGLHNTSTSKDLPKDMPRFSLLGITKRGSL